MNNDEVSKILSRIESDLIGDRSKIDSIIVRLEGVESRVNQVYSRLDRTEDKVHDAVQDIADSVSIINSKKVK